MHQIPNVIWQALTTRQMHLGDRQGAAAKFHPDVSLLGALAEPTVDAHASLAKLLPLGARVGLFLTDAIETPHFAIELSVPVLQMVHTEARPHVASQWEMIKLGDADVPEMLALTERTKPGPFNRRTHEMGDYFGIRDRGVLIAMAGERMRVPGHTEVSAICTHPDHVGRGLATALTDSLLARIYARDERPMLHVRADNTRAIALYERLGFGRGLQSRYVILQRRT